MRTSRVGNSGSSSGGGAVVHQPPTATATTTFHPQNRITSSNVSDSGHLIFGLYPAHSNINMTTAPNLGPDQQQQDAAATAGARSDKKIFYEQPDGHFASAAQEARLRQQRVATQAEIDVLRSAIPEWSPDDDAKTFAPFFLHVVFALTHVRRMLTGAAAGISLLILIALYWAPSLEGVSVDTNTNKIIPNSTVGGAFGAQCLPSAMDQCSAIVAYATIYKSTSYLFLVISLMGTFLSLVPFTFDIVLYNIRERQMRSGGTTSMAAIMASQNSNNALGQQQQQQQGAGNQYATAPALTNTAGGNTQAVGADGVAQTATSVMQTGPPVQTTPAYMALRHIITSTFPLFFVSLVCCMAMAKIEVDRRTQSRMVTITPEEASSLRTSIIIRSLVLILAWVFSFRFTEATPSDEVLNSAAVIDLRA